MQDRSPPTRRNLLATHGRTTRDQSSKHYNSMQCSNCLPSGCEAAMPLILYFLNCAPAASTSAAVLNRDSGTSQLRFVNYTISLFSCMRRG